MSILPWPAEAARYPGDSVRSFQAAGSNLALDFHGDPATAGLAIFSDGNHHMALEAVVRAFLAEFPEAEDVFYTTTPPAALVDALNGDGLAIGNLRISRKPNVFIGPEDILQRLQATGRVERHAAFAESRGNCILVRKHNPKQIATVGDLLSDDVALACSNPETEKASFSVYREQVHRWALQAELDPGPLLHKLSNAGPRTVHSQIIHHREVPELVAGGLADAAVIYYHLALRYTRIFPDIFELVDVGGIRSGENHVTTRYHVGLVGSGGDFGSAFATFLCDVTAQELYDWHGLKGAALN